MTDTTYQPTADEQADWNARLDRIAALRAEIAEIQQDAGHDLVWALRQDDSDAALVWAQESALEKAKRAVDLRDEIDRLNEQHNEHPYTAVVRARIAERRAAKAS